MDMCYCMKAGWRGAERTLQRFAIIFNVAFIVFRVCLEIGLLCYVSSSRVGCETIAAKPKSEDKNFEKMCPKSLVPIFLINFMAHLRQHTFH